MLALSVWSASNSHAKRWCAIVGAVACLSATANAQGPLGGAQQFSVLAATTITNAGTSFVNGNLGVAPGTAIPGLGSITLTGSVHQNDALAIQAQTDAASAYCRSRRALVADRPRSWEAPPRLARARISGATFTLIRASP